MRTAEQNRQGAAQVVRVRARIQAHLAWLDGEVADLDDQLRRRLRASPLWRERDDLLRSVPGSGPILSLTLPADLPELGGSRTRRSPRWPGWPHSTATVVRCAAGALSGAGARRCVACST